MAKKKHSKKRGGRKAGRRRGRRVSGVGAIGISMETLAGIAAGAAASKALNGVTKNIDMITKKPIILPALKVGIGFLGYTKLQNPFLRDMASGMVAEGALHALDVLAPNVFKAPLAGGAVGTVIDLDDNPLSGYDDMQVEQVVSGFEYNEVAGVI